MEKEGFLEKPNYLTLSDAKLIKDQLRKHGQVNFNFEVGMVGLAGIHISRAKIQLTRHLNGVHSLAIPNGNYFTIGVYGRGVFLFDMTDHLSANYIAEKLIITRYEAEVILDLLSKIVKKEDCYG